jgi:single-strand selective monofunctional uracil DNA glycosylase
VTETSIADELVAAAEELRRAANRLKFGRPVACTYNPLEYAWAGHEMYLRKFGDRRKRVVFLGMNPGPFGMAQTGVPFGEIASVRDWMKIEVPIGRPRREHPKHPITGFACPRSEVSGRRLWGCFAGRFGSARGFFADHFVANYCPLAFFDEAGRNLTPDKLPSAQVRALYTACDRHLRRIVEILQPEWLIGVGDFAARRAALVVPATPPRVGRMLHPSPASPAANQGWSQKALRQLKSLGIWRDE